MVSHPALLSSGNDSKKSRFLALKICFSSSLYRKSAALVAPFSLHPPTRHEAVADVHALEHVVRRLSGRRHQQQLAIRDKGRARQRVTQLWEQLASWSVVPGAVTPELGQGLTVMGALGSVLRTQQYPWAAQHNRGAPRLEASLRRVLQEEARSKEELMLIQKEVDRAVASYGHRVFLLEVAARNVPATSSHGRLLSLHLARQQRMLEGFASLRTSQDVPW
jgi:hypothetical protein